MRGIFEFFTIFDWITPSIGFIEDFINDPTLLQTNSWTFFVPYDDALSGGWNAVEIERILKESGIKTWGSQITNGEYFFSVKREQAQWAEYLLLRNRVPLHERSLGPPKPKQKRQSRKQQKKTQDNLLAVVDKYLDNLFK